jgi:hypothetical protein
MSPTKKVCFRIFSSPIVLLFVQNESEHVANRREIFLEILILVSFLYRSIPIMILQKKKIAVRNHSKLEFLTGDRELIFDLANKGFNLYAAQNDNVSGGFAYPGLFALIDKEGNIRCRRDDFEIQFVL